ncbi:MAG: S41 family peptidase [Treponema sp.]|jgi:carboxyl-terminal processing protease|nr:S41 family peptidase [Treponema sp.]
MILVYNILMSNEKEVPAQKDFPPGKVSLSLVWVFSTLVFAVIFALLSCRGVQAQTRQGGAGSQYTGIIGNVFEFIQRHYVEEVDPELLYEGAMHGMINALGDPYSSFLPESEMQGLNDTTQGNFGGVGLFITKPVAARPDGKPLFVEVASPIEDTPAWRAGINPGDFITEINGESTDLLSMDEVLGKLRGPPGVEVRLIIRRGEKLEFPVTLIRAVIEVPTVKHAMIGKTGYLKLLTFTPMTLDRSKEAVNEFESAGYTSLILDLRNNYGGLLNSAVGVGNLFFEGGIVVSTKSRINTENIDLYARNKASVPADIPVIVLINRGSASASEIVAGALKDRNRAYLVGEKTFGKGSVQQVYQLDNAGFKITTARYYTPSGVNIDKIGIPPDREVLFPAYTPEDAEKLNALINDGKISEFVKAHPNAASREVDAFVSELNNEYKLAATLLRRLVKNEQNRTVIAPVYDLEYDVQLQEAINIINKENFPSLMRAAKTLKALQEEALQDEEFATAS